MMKALVYHGPQNKSWEEKRMPKIIDSTDAVVKITKTTICGTKKIDATKLITHHFTLNNIIQAYETFGNAARDKALKVILTNEV